MSSCDSPINRVTFAYDSQPADGDLRRCALTPHGGGATEFGDRERFQYLPVMN